MRYLTSTLTAIILTATTILILMVALPALAQDYGNLTVKGEITCDRKADVMSTVTIYRYYHLSHSVELVEQQMVVRDGKFKFRINFDQEYIIDVASNTGVHKRINLNTEVMKGYKYDDQKFEFQVDVSEGDTDNPEEVAWIYFDPSKNDFSHSDQMPVAWQEK